jgi:hypothetical protein
MFLSIVFKGLFELLQSVKLWLLVFSDPARGDLVDGNWVEVVQFVAPAPDDCDEIRLFEQNEMLGDRLPRHAETLRKFAKGLSGTGVETVEQETPAGIGQGLEDGVFIHRENFMQLYGCLSTESYCIR